MYYHCIVFFDVQNLVLCLTRKTTFILPLLVKKSSKSNKSRLRNNVFKKCGFI